MPLSDPELTQHLQTLQLRQLCLEIFASESMPSQQLPRIQALNQLVAKAWPFILSTAEETKLYEGLPLDFSKKVLEVELSWITNEAMQSLNREYREKDTPTDVLTFTLLADAPDPKLWLSLPILQLGSIFISLDYADNAHPANTPSAQIEHYLLERFIHGMLHLFGMHHNTQEKFEKVVAFQQQVLNQIPEVNAPHVEF